MEAPTQDWTLGKCPPISLLMEAPTIDALDRSSLAESPNSLLMEAPKVVIAYGKDGASQLILMSKQPVVRRHVSKSRITTQKPTEGTARLNPIAYLTRLQSPDSLQ